MPKKRSTPSFVMRLIGENVSPERVPVRALSDAASAVTRLASGQPDETDAFSVHLLGVRRGSAVYPCLMEAEHDTDSNLKTLGEVIENPGSDLLTHHMLKPIDSLSKIAAKLECGEEKGSGAETANGVA